MQQKKSTCERFRELKKILSKILRNLFLKWAVFNSNTLFIHFLDNVHHPLGLLHSENNVSVISTEKALYQNIEKHPFSAYSTRLLTSEAKIEKKLLSTKIPDSHQISKLSDIRSRILVSLKKLRDSCLTAVNQMVDGSETKPSNTIAKPKIDLPNVGFKNAQSAFV